MPRFNHPLNHVRVASPCKADWDQMIGSEQVRFCGQCSLNVYNLSGMSRDQAESLIVRNEGRLCVRFYRRNDGSVLTSDCPVGWRAMRQRTTRIAKAVAAYALAFLASLGIHVLLPAIPPVRSPPMMGTLAATNEMRPVTLEADPGLRPIVGRLIKIPRSRKRK
jgi:hypothetical protein